MYRKQMGVTSCLAAQNATANELRGAARHGTATIVTAVDALSYRRRHKGPPNTITFN